MVRLMFVFTAYLLNVSRLCVRMELFRMLYSFCVLIFFQGIVSIETFNRFITNKIYGQCKQFICTSLEFDVHLNNQR